MGLLTSSHFYLPPSLSQLHMFVPVSGPSYHCKTLELLGLVMTQACLYAALFRVMQICCDTSSSGTLTNFDVSCFTKSLEEHGVI